MNTVIEASKTSAHRLEATAVREEALHWLVVAALSVCVLAAWIARPAAPAPGQPRLTPVAAVTAPYESPYPAPRVDPAAPPQEPAPTF